MPERRYYGKRRWPPPPPPPPELWSLELVRNVPPGKSVWRCLLTRALARRCPVCGAGRPFPGWLTMRERCEACGYRFEREEGYWLGSMTLNYLVAGALGLALFIGASPLWSWPIWLQMALWGLFATAAVLAAFPYTRLAWILFDWRFLRPPGPPDFPPAGPERTP